MVQVTFRGSQGQFLMLYLQKKISTYINAAQADAAAAIPLALGEAVVIQSAVSVQLKMLQADSWSKYNMPE